MHSNSHGDTGNNSDAIRISRLKRARQDDQYEEYREERELTETTSTGIMEDDIKEEDWVTEPPPKKGMSVAEKIMLKLGHKQGEGLGKNRQGISEPVALSTQRGRTGLGSSAGKAVGLDLNEEWDESAEEKTIEENVSWIPECDTEKRHEICEQLHRDNWIVVGEKKMKIDDETEFCNEDILFDMLKAKDVFDHMSDRDLREARTRANPYETIGGAFFQNRAAMKTANIDKVYDWILSRETTTNDFILRKNPLDSASTPENVDRKSDIFYFADVCAGPGGFSEYMLWRKGFYNAKGFGFTLAGKDDFKMNKFCASSAYYFEPFYGTKQNGDVMDPENIESLENFVMKGTNNEGVHLMMADGGFSVEGQENLQEILSKRLYLCQLLVSLCIVRNGGNFFCKLFDIFTPFSVSLIYLMRICYEKISLHKPHTSRPANSERYIICQGLKREFSDIVRDYLKRVNKAMDKLGNEKNGKDIQEILPLNILKDDEVFFNNVVEHNHKLAIRQTMYLRKYQSFAKNQGQFDKDQGNLRDECLKYWMVPNRQKQRNGERSRQSLNAYSFLGEHCTKNLGDSDLSIRPIQFDINFLKSQINNLTYEEYRLVKLSTSSCATILVSTCDSVFLYRRGHFETMERDLARIPQNTIVLVEVPIELTKSDDKVKKVERSPGIIRILDAALLNGDDVSKLPYEERLDAAKKFCKALTLVNRSVKIGWGKNTKYMTPFALTAAEVYKLDQIDELKEKLEVTCRRDEVSVHFTENGFLQQCHGIRFIRVFKAEWQIGWSKSKQLPYSHSPRHQDKGSKFEEFWKKEGCYSSFWDSAVSSQRDHESLLSQIRANGPVGVPVPCAVWKWENSLSGKYGLKIILDHPEEYEGNLTLSSLKKHIELVDAECSRHR